MVKAGVCKTPIVGSIPTVASKFSDTKTAHSGRFLVARSGDFDPESSVIDLPAATSSDVSDTEFDALRAMHLDSARDNPGWEDRVEVAHLPVTALRTFRSERSPVAVISPGKPFHMMQAGGIG